MLTKYAIDRRFAPRGVAVMFITDLLIVVALYLATTFFGGLDRYFYMKGDSHPVYMVLSMICLSVTIAQIFWALITGARYSYGLVRRAIRRFFRERPARKEERDYDAARHFGTKAFVRPLEPGVDLYV